MDTLDIEEMELDSLEVPIIQDVSVSHKPEIKPSETQQIEAVENNVLDCFSVANNKYTYEFYFETGFSQAS